MKVIAYKIQDRQSMKQLSKYDAISVDCGKGPLVQFKPHSHLSSIDNLNLCMMEQEDDIILITEKFSPLGDLTELNSTDSLVGIIGQQSSLTLDHSISEDDIAGASLIFDLDQVQTGLLGRYFFSSCDVVRINAEVIARTKGFDPDYSGVNLTAMMDLCHRAYKLCGRYTIVTPLKVAVPQQVNYGDVAILKRKHDSSGRKLADTARRIYSRKILTT